jgi:predicted esterase
MSEQQIGRSARQGRFLARPAQKIEHTTPPFTQGLHPLLLDETRDAFLYVPSRYQEDSPTPLVVMLHGATGTAQGGLAPFLAMAETHNMLLLAPSSRLQTWDVILYGFGPDVAFIDTALAYVFSHYAIDTTHLALEGFSDGASYALSLGLTNGDLFTHIIAFSPGFMRPAQHVGSPLIYIAHGKSDPVLPIDRCSRGIVPQLKSSGYDVRYHEFVGFHSVPKSIAQESLHWFLTET